MPEMEKPVPAWLEQERSKWRRFELTSEDKTQVDELNAIINRYKLSRRELAVIVETLQVRPEFTLDDFRSEEDTETHNVRKRLTFALLDFVERAAKGGALLESDVQALPGVAAVLAGLLAE